MRDATKKVAKKSAAKKTVAKKSESPDVLVAARQALGAIAERESVAPPNIRLIVMLAIADISTLVKVTNNNGALTVFPKNLLQLQFNDNKVGLDDDQMPLFYGRIITAINDNTVTALINKNLIPSHSANVQILKISNLIELWVENPDMAA